MANPTVAKNIQAQPSSTSIPIPITYDQNLFAPLQEYYNKIWSDILNAPNFLGLLKANNTFWPSAAFNALQPLKGLTALQPETDIIENGKAFKICIELPGLEEKDVEVSINENYLTISGEKKEKHDTENENSVVRECSYGTFSRTIQLPETADAGKAEAHFNNGVLTVKLPKKAAAIEGMRTLKIH